VLEFPGIFYPGNGTGTEVPIYSFVDPVSTVQCALQTGVLSFKYHSVILLL